MIHINNLQAINYWNIWDTCRTLKNERKKQARRDKIGNNTVSPWRKNLLLMAPLMMTRIEDPGRRKVLKKLN